MSGAGHAARPKGNHKKLEYAIDAVKKLEGEFGSTLMTVGIAAIKKKYSASETQVPYRLY